MFQELLLSIIVKHWCQKVPLQSSIKYYCKSKAIWVAPPRGRCWHSLVESHHAPCDGHVHGNLGRHPPKDEHLLSCVWMERRVVQVLGPPYLVSADTWWLFALPGTHMQAAGMKLPLETIQCIIEVCENNVKKCRSFPDNHFFCMDGSERSFYMSLR